MKKIVLLISLTILLSQAQVGRTETVGYTTYDRQYGGPTVSWCRVNPVGNNILVYWIYSDLNPSIDRNMRCNIYDFSINNWYWPEGMNVYPQYSGFGNIDYDPGSGKTIAVTHQTWNNALTPVCAREISGGLFEYSIGPANYVWPLISVGYNQAIHCIMMHNIARDSLWYSKVQPWNIWSTPINISSPAPSPRYPNYNIHTSKISNKVLILWQVWADDGQNRAFYRLSNDGGINWQAPTQIPFPPSQGLVPSYTTTSLFGMFDCQDNFHIVASVSDTQQTIPAEIWHYCPSNTTPWSLIHHYNAQTLAAPVGYNAIFATRPSIVQNPTNHYLYVVWEQFDSLNYEPTTFLARADIWIAESPDNGLTWRNQTRITLPDSTSKRFPCAGGVVADTLILSYLVDSVAGQELYMQGRTTRNPIVVQRIPIPLTGIAENPILQVSGFTLSISPNPFSSHTTIRFTLPASNQASLQIYDVTGRLIKSFTDNQQLTTNNYLTWNGKDNNNQSVPYGIYFIKLETENNRIVQKVIYTK
ncbi:MAG: T9SS type A sorting domain-containing protein [Candidatus Latescibacteria bacterium]|nr:T9SS type A sorting domain-containing protein [Candidatus Latescibacterota bacterium]